uniref:Mitochondrial import inner membrane translocase subunit TIM50 n=1 Tax=Oryza barthii TaxID=65489 RepID=A0A0D3EUB6_9ORYZ
MERASSVAAGRRVLGGAAGESGPREVGRSSVEWRERRGSGSSVEWRNGGNEGEAEARRNGGAMGATGVTGRRELAASPPTPLLRHLIPILASSASLPPLLLLPWHPGEDGRRRIRKVGMATNQPKPTKEALKSLSRPIMASVYGSLLMGCGPPETEEYRVGVYAHSLKSGHSLTSGPHRNTLDSPPGLHLLPLSPIRRLPPPPSSAPRHLALGRLSPCLNPLLVFSKQNQNPSPPTEVLSPSSRGATTPWTASRGRASSSRSPPARKPLGLLKGGVLAVVASAFGATGYVSYAYSLDEIDQRTREFRKNSKLPIRDDLSGFEKFQAMAYSAAMKVPVAAIEFYLDTRSQIEDQIRGFSEPSSDKLLPDLLPQEQHVFTLVLDLNETLVYSDWKRERGWRTFKRPGVDAFLEHLGKFYEIVVYSDQLSMYVDPVIERLDPKGCVRHRLSRVATKYENGKHYRVW